MHFGVADILIAVVDGLKGFPEAINAVSSQVQTCGVDGLPHGIDVPEWGR
ncbi:transposase [Mesorhizobium sp. LNHC252B00]|nr:transposase [Mesorhizobium sp. LNHC252B00]